jgi:hypothetical protein
MTEGWMQSDMRMKCCLDQAEIRYWRTDDELLIAGLMQHTMTMTSFLLFRPRLPAQRVAITGWTGSQPDGRTSRRMTHFESRYRR